MVQKEAPLVYLEQRNLLIHQEAHRTLLYLLLFDRHLQHIFMSSEILKALILPLRLAIISTSSSICNPSCTCTRNTTFITTEYFI